MAEPIPFKFDLEKCKQKLEAIRSFQKQFAGKTNMNPFIWIHNNLEPLSARLIKGEATKELHDLIHALKETPPVVDPSFKVPEPPPKEEVKPLGLKL